MPVTKFKALRPAHKASAQTESSNAVIAKPVSQAKLLADLETSNVWMLKALNVPSIHQLLPASIAKDSVPQVRAGLAFHSTRLYTRLGQEEDIAAAELSALPSVASIKMITSDIALITTSDENAYHLITATGEIIGTTEEQKLVHRRSLTLSNPAPIQRILRADWTRLIEEARKKSIGIAASLVEEVQSPDLEHFKHGLSKHYLTRLDEMPDQTEAEQLQEIAHSYILAHVAVSHRMNAKVYWAHSGRSLTL